MNLLALLWSMAESLFIKPLQHYRPQSINLLKIQTRQLNLIRVTVIFPPQAQQVIKYYFTALIKFHWIWCKCNARDHHRGHYGKYVCFNLHWLRIYVVLESLYWIANEKYTLNDQTYVTTAPTNEQILLFQLHWLLTIQHMEMQLFLFQYDNDLHTKWGP